MVDENGESQPLAERLARAQFDAEGHTRRGGLPARWDDLPEGNREHRLGWADKVIDTLNLHLAYVEYEWSDLDTFMFGVLNARAWEMTHDRRPERMLAFDWVAEAWLPERHPKRQMTEMIAAATVAAADRYEAEHTGGSHA